MSFPYLARTTLKYKSPHVTDLSFAKGDTIRVTGPSPDDEDWLVGETLDGSNSGGFPKDFIEVIEGEEQAPTDAEPPAESAVDPSAAPTEMIDPGPVTVTSPQSEPAPVQATQATIPEAPAASTPAPAPAPAPAGPDSDSPSKPQSMKDRLAFFQAAQNKPSPPPPVKPKPSTGGLTWSQRQKLKQEQEAKEREEAAARGEVPAAPAPTGAAAHAPNQSASSPSLSTKPEPAEEGHGTGMSAADALSSITKGGSLKERMAALAGSDVLGGGGGDVAAKGPPPAPSGKVWKRPVAPRAPTPEAGDELDGGAADDTVKVKSPSTEETDPGSISQAAEESLAEGGEQATEEDEEKARRAAIAARMAKIGARGPMGMMPPAKPIKKPTAELVSPPLAEGKSDPIAATAEPEKETEGTTSAEASAPVVAISPEQPAVPKSVPIAAIPRRAAPPRRRTATKLPSGTDTPVLPTEPIPAASSETSPTEPEVTAKSSEREIAQETTDSEGHPVPPKQVMVFDEEAPLPKSDEQLREQKKQEERGMSIGGLEGAKSAGIPVSQPDDMDEQAEEGGIQGGADEQVETETVEPLVGAIGGADKEERGQGSFAAEAGPGQIESTAIPPPSEVEEGLPEGGDENDPIMLEAQNGTIVLDEPPMTPTADYEDYDVATPLSPEPIAHVPLRPAAPDSPSNDNDDDAPAPPPRRRRMTIEDMPLDELEMKHVHEHVHESPTEAFSGHSHSETLKEDGEAAPPPPPRRSLDKPAGPRPLPTNENQAARQPSQSPEKPATVHAHARALPPPPPAMVPPRDESEEEREADGLGDEEVSEADEEEDVSPPLPPARKEVLPVPVQTGVPTPAAPPKAYTAPTESPELTETPSHSRSLEKNPASEDVEDSSRRSGIAARMAKLGGIRIGALPPPPTKKQSLSVVPPEATAESQSADVVSPNDREPAVPSPKAPEETAPAEVAEESEETPEQESARRRATLARLRAGGALGFGLFNQAAPPEEAEQETNDQRGLEDEPAQVAEEPEEPPLPSARHISLPPPPPLEEEENDAPPLPSLARPHVVTSFDDDAPSPPPRAPSHPGVTSPISPSSPTMSRSRPPVPSTEKRHSLSHSRQSVDLSRPPPPPPHQQDNAFEKNEEEAPPPIPHMRIGHAAGVYGAHRRSTSTSRPSRTSIDQAYSTLPSIPDQSSAAVRTTSPGQVHEEQLLERVQSQSQQNQGRMSSEMYPVRQGAGTRPAHDQLRAASASHGAALVKAAMGIFSQGKKGHYGDGSPEGFVLTAMDQAQINQSTEGWGQVVFEQEAGSILRKYDEPRAGDIAAFHDAKFKGKKGLHTYSQHVGSVRDPLVGVVSDFEERKHKMRLLQVDRGVPDEVSYRCDDLKSGKIVVYRQGLS